MGVDELINVDLREPFLFDAPREKLEYFILLCMSVAGKKAIIQQEKLNVFVQKTWQEAPDENSLFKKIDCLEFRNPGFIDSELRNVKLGRYSVMTQGIMYLLDATMEYEDFLLRASRDDLLRIPGVSYKTASFFLLYTRKGMRIACLDRHILRFLSRHGVVPSDSVHKAPKKDKYLYYEEKFLDLCGEVPPYEMDIQIWREYNKSFN